MNRSLQSRVTLADRLALHRLGLSPAPLGRYFGALRWRHLSRRWHAAQFIKCRYLIVTHPGRSFACRCPTELCRAALRLRSAPTAPLGDSVAARRKPPPTSAIRKKARSLSRRTFPAAELRTCPPRRQLVTTDDVTTGSAQIEAMNKGRAGSVAYFDGAVPREIASDGRRKSLRAAAPDANAQTVMECVQN